MSFKRTTSTGIERKKRWRMSKSSQTKWIERRPNSRLITNIKIGLVIYLMWLTVRLDGYSFSCIFCIVCRRCRLGCLPLSLSCSLRFFNQCAFWYAFSGPLGHSALWNEMQTMISSDAATNMHRPYCTSTLTTSEWPLHLSIVLSASEQMESIMRIYRVVSVNISLALNDRFQEWEDQTKHSRILTKATLSYTNYKLYSEKKKKKRTAKWIFKFW